MPDRFPQLSTDAVLELEQLRFRFRFALSPYAMRHGELRRWEHDALERLVYEVNTHVLGRRARDELEIVEEPHFPTWRHHLVASLPDGFRRRWLADLWGMQDNVLAKRRRHYISVEARVVFPDAEVVVPRDKLGEPYRFASVSSFSRLEDA